MPPGVATPATTSRHKGEKAMDDQSGFTRREALKRAGLLAGAVVVGGPALAACSKSLDSKSSSGKSGKNKAPVLLGIVDPYTGPFAASGTSQTQGAEVAVAELNAAGGILGGRQIEIRKRDDATKADIGARGARESLSRRRVPSLRARVGLVPGQRRWKGRLPGWRGSGLGLRRGPRDQISSSCAKAAFS